MSDEQEPVSEEQCGERLKKAREELGIPLSTISKELHLDEAKVEALERNEFQMLGAPVFAKGHLRKYAQMVKVDIDQILFDYHQLTRADGLPPVVSDRKRPSLPKSPTPWIVAVIVLLVGLAAWFGWQFYLTQKADTATLIPASSPVVVSESVRLPSSTSAAVAAVEQFEPEQPDLVEEQPSSVAQDVPASGAVALQLTFSGDCWTEVTDSSGKRLFFDLGSAGDEINVQGKAPVSVLLGNARNVRLLVNGRDYQIAPVDRNGDTARFTLYGS
jgi:cytoskeleton protein RodZ